MAPVHQPPAFSVGLLLNVVSLLVGLWLLLRSIRILRARAKFTLLRGPESKSLIFGNSHFLRYQKDVPLVYEEWAEQYGHVFRVPIALGKTQVILCDPKAIQHFYSKDTYGYVHGAMTRFLVINMVCVLSEPAKWGKAKVYDRLGRGYCGQQATVIKGG